MKILIFTGLALLAAFGVASHYQLAEKKHFVNCLDFFSLGKCELIFKE